MNSQSNFTRSTLRKQTNRINASASPSITKRSPKSKQKFVSTDLSTDSLFSTDYHYYQSSARVTALVGTLTVLFVLLYQNFKVFTNWQGPTTVQGHEDNILTDSEPGLSGWRLPDQEVLQKYGSDLCTIERVSLLDLSSQRFEDEFRFKKPVLVTFPNGARDWTEPKKWSKSELMRGYSKQIIHSGQSLEIVRKGGNANHASSLENFIMNLMATQKQETHEPM